MPDPSERPAFDRELARRFILQASEARDQGVNEEVIRQLLVAGLNDIFPPTQRPWWVTRHIRGAESHMRFGEAGRARRGRSDSVVGLTAIEYEPDLRKGDRYAGGLHQVRQYCAGLLNEGAAGGLVRGVLSDTVEWYGYELANLPEKLPGEFAAEDVDLRELEHVFPSADDLGVDRLVDFLLRYLGREGTRPLAAKGLAEYLGPQAVSAETIKTDLAYVVRAAIEGGDPSVDVVQTLWVEFMSYLSEDHQTTFDEGTYAEELYVVMLARLICANVLRRHALRSDDAELDRILRGDFFRDAGLHRLVEYDYFGWLTSDRYIGATRAAARAIQGELTAFNFESVRGGDLFGDLLSRLAGRNQRILLGQESTPPWLANLMARGLFERLHDDAQPRFIDMCCGSGAMLVEVSSLARERLADAGIAPGSQSALDYLASAATGFDIDPLAVVLAKVNWVVSNRDWLEPFDGSRFVSVPVYHADSLFSVAPVFGEDLGLSDGDDRVLELEDHKVVLPRSLVTPASQRLFDAILDRAYGAGTGTTEITPAVIERLVSDAVTETDAQLSADVRDDAEGFVRDLTGALRKLHEADRNGVWAFIIRNSYRPALVAGQFNGLISNPPWLALSRIANNPLASAIRERADRFNLRPGGSAFLHLDISTTFLAYASDRYLEDGALIACVLPGSIRRGSHHRPFREQASRFGGAPCTINLDIEEMWRVSEDTFPTNIAMVVIGRKGAAPERVQFPELRVDLTSADTATLHVQTVGDRMVWADSAVPAPPSDPYPVGTFQEGADLMPRKCVFVDAVGAGRGRVTISAPSRGTGAWYLVRNAKVAQKFVTTTRTVPERFLSLAWVSKHLVPFRLARPGACVLPIERVGQGWQLMPDQARAADAGVAGHFSEAARAAGYDRVEDWFERLDFRSKLTSQAIGDDGFLVVYGAGGGRPCAAAVPLTEFARRPAVIDQTLYWCTCATLDETLYMVGMINSSAILERVRQFAPEGLQNERHLHTLPSQFLPRFDGSLKHVAVASATRQLAREMESAGNDMRDAFEPSANITWRRMRIRHWIAGLASFGDYDAACDDVFA